MLFLFFQLLLIFCSTQQTYRVASVSLIELESTIPTYKKFVKEAKEEKAELIAFPEISLGATEKDGENITVNSTPCYDANPVTKPRQFAMSCAAIENDIYVVFSLIEYSNDKIYNTAIAIDRKGVIISRYRKTHILMKFLSVGDSGPTYFKTDFGVTFGMFICFDILFKHPAEVLTEKYSITDFIYPQMWAHEPPFDALQVQQSFSEYFEVNLIASNNHFQSKGSGHFSSGEVINYSMNDTSDVLLISDFPFLKPQPTHKVPSISTEWKTLLEQKWFQSLHDDTTSSSSSSNSLVIDTDYFSCNFTYSVDTSKTFRNHWFTFYAWRFGGKIGPPPTTSSSSSTPPFVDFMLYEDICGVSICPPGNNAPLLVCLNGTDNFNAGTYFDTFELSITLRDNVRSLRTALASDNYDVFHPTFKQFDLTHDFDVHSVKMIKYEGGFQQPILSVAISGMLNNFE